MATEITELLEGARAKLAALEAELAKRRLTMPTLHLEYGYYSIEEFIDALKAIAKQPRLTANDQTSQAAHVAPRGRKPGAKRATITPEIKQQLKVLLSQGKTNAFIAEALIISQSSVQNIKKELGLIRAQTSSRAGQTAALQLAIGGGR